MAVEWIQNSSLFDFSIFHLKPCKHYFRDNRAYFWLRTAVHFTNRHFFCWQTRISTCRRIRDKGLGRIRANTILLLSVLAREELTFKIRIWSSVGGCCCTGAASPAVMYASDLTPRPRPHGTTAPRNHFMLISTFGPNHHIYSAARLHISPRHRPVRTTHLAPNSEA